MMIPTLITGIIKLRLLRRERKTPDAAAQREFVSPLFLAFPPSAMSSSSRLTAEIVQTILDFLIDQDRPAAILALAYLSPVWRNQVRLALFTNLAVASTSATRLLLRSYADSPLLQTLSRSLSLIGGVRRSAAVVGRKGKGADDSVTPEDLVLLATRLSLESLALRQVEFTSLRRRQVHFTQSLPGTLRSLSVAGRHPTSEGDADGGCGGCGFNLHTLGILLSSLSSLTHLAISNIHASPTSLLSLPPPTYRLAEFALISTSALLPSHVAWLLLSTSHAESLRHLTLSWSSDSPRILNPVRFLSWPVTHLSLSTATPGVPEALALHFPSLRKLDVRSTCSVDFGRLVRNLEGARRLEVFVDRSEAGGVEVEEIGRVLSEEGDRLEGLRMIGVGESSEELEKVCAARGIRIEVLAKGDVGGEEPYVPPR